MLQSLNKINRTSPSWIFFAISIFLFSFIPVWLFLIAPQLNESLQAYNTNAELISLDGLSNVVAKTPFNSAVSAPLYNGKKAFNYVPAPGGVPINMQFADKEKIDGVMAYRFVTQYRSDKADVILQLWIEPISGWLVKYQSNKMVAGHQYLNRYTQESTQAAARAAQQCRAKILMIDFGLPITLFVLSLFCCWLGYQKYSYPYVLLLPPAKSWLRAVKRGAMPSFIGLFLASASGGYYYYHNAHNKPDHIIVGISQWSDASSHVEAVRGFKQGLAESGFKEGENIQFILQNPHANLELQINIIESFIKQQAHAIFTLSTPGTLTAKVVTNHVPVIYADVASPNVSGVVQDNLVGVSNEPSIVPSLYFLDKIVPKMKLLAFIHRRDDADAEREYIALKILSEKKGIVVLDIAATDLNDLRKQLLPHVKQINALFLACHSLVHQQGVAEFVAEYGRQNKIASFSCDQHSISSGVLIGYIVDYYAMGIEAGKMAAMILHGTHPKWLQQHATVKHDVAVNLATAQLLGVSISEKMLQQSKKMMALTYDRDDLV